MYKQVIKVKILKPIYGNYVGIREKYIRQAQKYHKDLQITTPNGVTTISPTRFLQGAERIEKVFLIPEHPMVLYCKNLVPDKEEPKEELITIPNEARERLREMAIEKGWYKRAGNFD